MLPPSARACRRKLPASNARWPRPSSPILISSNALRQRSWPRKGSVLRLSLQRYNSLKISSTSSNPEFSQGRCLRASRVARFPLEELPDLLRGPRPVAARKLDADGGDELARVPRHRLGASARSDRGSAAAAHPVPVPGGGRLG